MNFIMFLPVGQTLFFFFFFGGGGSNPVTPSLNMALSSNLGFVLFFEAPKLISLFR